MDHEHEWGDPRAEQYGFRDIDTDEFTPGYLWVYRPCLVDGCSVVDEMGVKWMGPVGT